ncbi:MAG TPA: zinc-binding dehydrogenase, partial [Terriglobia bacterium]|nr:zinc-binding dehydrogenase [Terriglobia bacterium]
FMKAVVFNQHGGPEVLQYVDVPDPRPGPGEVLIEVKATSINHIDIFLRRGMPGIKVPLPKIVGSDAAGIIRELGRDVSGLMPGQRVTINPGITCGHCEFCSAGFGSQCVSWAMVGENRDGAYAEFVVVPAHIVLPIPDHISFEEAAAAPLVFLTAWSMMVGKGNIRPGEDVLILGAGAGVGTAAIQIAKLVGCRVFATASNAEKLQRAKELGADFLINYTTEEFDKAIRELTNKRGVDIVVDYIGADTWVRSLRSARRGGRVLTCGATTGFAPQTDLRHIFFRQVQVLGSTMGSHREFLDVMKCVFRGQLKPVIDRVLPLPEARKGHELIEQRAVFGKIVLTNAFSQL